MVVMMMPMVSKFKQTKNSKFGVLKQYQVIFYRVRGGDDDADDAFKKDFKYQIIK